ncbi:mitochondrial ribonuclease P catalytic subunit-like [Argonauta hians]
MSISFHKLLFFKFTRPYQTFTQIGRLLFHKTCFIHTPDSFHVKLFSRSHLLNGFNNDNNGFLYKGRRFSSLEDYSENEDFDNFIHTKSNKLNGSSNLFDFKEKLDSKSITEMTLKDWFNLEKSFLGDNPSLKVSWEAYCMSMFNSHGLVELGVSLIDYIKSQDRSPNIATTAVFMALLSCRASPKDQKTILQLYQDVIGLTGGLLDSQTIRFVIKALCCTDKWKSCFELLSTLELTQPSLPKYLTPIILAAIRSQDINSCFRLLHEAGSKGFSPDDAIYLAFLKASESDSKFSIEDLFHVMCKYRWIPSKDVLLTVVKYFKRDGNKEGWSEAWIRLNKNGKCPNCHSPIDRLDIPFSEFRKLRELFFDKVLVGTDIYQKTNPAELEDFKYFVAENAPFDLVFDSLNVSFKIGQLRNKSLQLRRVVEYFALEKKKKILVIGRKYMKRWPEKDINVIKKLASCFFLEDISEDDPYLLYAALYSGPKCLFISSDEMRDHKFCLGEEYGEVFRRWQFSHQIQLERVRPNGHVIFQWPRKEDIRTQKSPSGWHIPFDDQEVKPSWQGTNTWLCLYNNKYNNNYNNNYNNYGQNRNRRRVRTSYSKRSV